MENVILAALLDDVKITLTPDFGGKLTKLSFIKEIKMANGRNVKASFRPKVVTNSLTVELPKLYSRFKAYCDMQGN